MHQYRIFISALIVLSMLSGAAWGADVAKIGVVDAQRVLETSSAGQAARAQIKDSYTKMEEDMKKRGAEFEELKKQFERNAMVMSQEKREDTQREMQIKQLDLQQLGKKYSGDLKELEQKLTGRIQKDVLDLTEEIGKEEGYLMIVNKPAVLYNPTAIDITDKLIQKYNTKFGKGQAEASKKN
ncbi:MAG: OmpH family outer membrane protein [Deltaproteobacteria bacterium]|nr:OmpH family outer membrane protein [Deltaproteobacteria bacterium]